MRYFAGKILSLLISAALCFSICACTHLNGRSNNAETDAIETDAIETDHVETDATTSPVESTDSTPQGSLEDRLNAMMPVFDAIAYIMTYESETHTYDSQDPNFVASTLFLGSSMYGEGIFRTAEWDADGYLEVPYSEMEEMAHACFADMMDDFTASDNYGRMHYDESTQIFYVGGGDGEYGSLIENFRELDNGTTEVTFDVWDPVEDVLAARYIFLLVENEFSKTIEAPLYSYSVEAVTWVA